MVALERQSPDIAQGVDGKGVYTKDDLGAGDQGMMFGFACDETPEFMPAPIQYAQAHRPVAIDTVVLSTQHDEAVKYKTLKDAVMEEVVKPVLPAKLLSS